MASKKKSAKLELLADSSAAGDFDRLYQLYLEKLAPLVHQELVLERCFRPGICGSPVPDSFPYVFWRASALFDREAWQLARQIMPRLYQLYLSRGSNHSASTHLADRERSLLASMLGYALWRGELLSIWELALSLFSRNLYCKEVFSLAALAAAYSGKAELAQWCYDIVHERSPWFSKCYRMLRLANEADRSQDSNEQLREQFQEQLRPETGFASSATHLLWLEAAFAGDSAFEGALIRKIKRTVLGSGASEAGRGGDRALSVEASTEASTERLIDFYAGLVCRGHLYRANRLLLCCLRSGSEQPHLLQAVLACYLQNRKLWLYLRRLAASPLWPGRRAWFESCYAILSLGLKDRLEELMPQLLENKRNPALPPKSVRQKFQRAYSLASETDMADYSFHPRADTCYVDMQLLRAAESPWEECATLRNFDCLDLILDCYLRAAGSREALLQRRYQFCSEIFLNRLSLERGPVHEEIMSYCEALFWTIRTYINRFERCSAWRLIEALAGRSLPLRALLAMRHFESSRVAEAGRLLSSVGSLHPSICNLRSRIALAAGRPQEARQIYKRLVLLFPEDAQIRSNYERLFFFLTD